MKFHPPITFPPITIPLVALILGVMSYKFFPNLIGDNPSFLQTIIFLLLGIGIALLIGNYFFRPLNPFLKILPIISYFILWGGLGYALQTIEKLEPTNSIRNLDGLFLEIKGVALSEQQIQKFGRNIWVEVDSVSDGKTQVKSSGKVLLSIPTKVQFYSRSTDSLRFQGKFTTIDSLINKPKSANFGRYLEQNGIKGTVKYNFKSKKIIKCGQSPTITAKLIRFRHKWEEALYSKMLSEREAGLAIALLLGEKSYLDKDLKTSYVTAGLAHILALSGSHIAVLVLALNGLLKLLEYIPTKLGGKYINRGKYWIVGGILLAYMILTGLSPSVVRACIMGCVFLIARANHLKGDITNITLLTALGQIIFQPSILYDIGFQLSYIAVLGIIWIYPSLEFFLLYTLKKRIKRNRDNISIKIGLKTAVILGEIICVTIAAHFSVVVLGIFYFETTQVYFLLSNILVTSLSIGAMWVGLLFLMTFGIPYFSDGVAFLLEKILFGMNILTEWIASLPYSSLGELKINLIHVIFYYLVWIVFIYGLRYFAWKKATKLKKSYRLIKSSYQ